MAAVLSPRLKNMDGSFKGGRGKGVIVRGCIFSFLGKIRIKEDIVVECKGLKKFGVGIFNEEIINLFFVLASNFCFR